MSRFDELPKAYDASLVEDDIYKAWEESGVFDPDKLPARNQAGEPYCIVLPPPNRTGTLHMGHASMLAIEDLMIRFERMRGKRALWIPGTDHAAIATQVKVEQLLMKEGMKDPRKELGREKLLEKVHEFADKSADTIRNQVRKMGSSCDWSRECYTLDADRNLAVNEVFKMMVEDGLIERGYRVVNWDPQFQTTLSDDEVLTKETTAKLLTFKYDKDFPITISTTRPETKFGDTAVAVHPTDERYKNLIGQTIKANFCGKEIHVKIIADEAVDPTFGTGALGVTPAHSMIDAEIAVRHNLPTVQVIGKDGKMTGDAGSQFSGLTVLEAREKVEETLRASGLLESEPEIIPQNLPVAERGGAPVESLPMRQWFIRVNKKFAVRQDTLGRWKKGEEATLKELMIHAVESGQTKIVPERFDKIYFHWINNLHDWCISRQIWFGHQIPVWYGKGTGYRVQGTEEDMSGLSATNAESHPSLTREGTGEDAWVVSDVSPGEGWERDPDSLDTWFSSGLWTFSTLGYPDKEKFEKMRAFHPTAVLETGYDILFFWVARMILMSTYVLGEVPFKNVYLHGLVRDEQGRKMSKSLGNILDPLDLIPKYGTDAVRLSLLMGTTPGQDMKLSEQKVEGFRNFTNKLWNISRFILMQMGDSGEKREARSEKTVADKWILAQLDETIASVTKKMEKYEFSAAGEELRDFTWNDLADWYLEIAKIEKGKEEILSHILQSILKLWHPFMPFVTESIWKQAGFEGALIVSEWPEQGTGYGVQGTGNAFDTLRFLITDMRRLRAEQGIEPVKLVEFAIVSDEATKNLIESNIEVVKQLTRSASVTVVVSIAEGWASTVSGSATIGLNIAGAIDVEKEKAKLQKELAEVEPYIVSTKAKLANAEFTSRAPAHVIDGMKAKLEEAEGKKIAIKERLKTL
jgi:valyl-tRNA synthetase